MRKITLIVKSQISSTFHISLIRLQFKLQIHHERLAMKSFARITRIPVYLYNKFWYVPVFLFLIGFKICIISLLVSSLEEVSYTSNPDLSRTPEDANAHLASKKTKAKTKQRAAASLDPKLKPQNSPIPLVIRREWETLADLEHAIIRPTHANRTDPSSIWLVFNRIPRTGGELLVNLLEELSSRNRFSHQSHEYRTPWPRFLLEQEQESLVSWFEYQHLPKSYDRHFYFVNFTRYQKFTKEAPIYINMLRDPVDRLKSEFHARRRRSRATGAVTLEPSEGLDVLDAKLSFEECVLRGKDECGWEGGAQDFQLSTPFFCGQHNACVVVNDRWGLQRAKFTMERHYSVVGVLERLPQTLAVLEGYVPRFFTGIRPLYDKVRGEAPNSTSTVPTKIRRILERKLWAEVELYKFATQRLERQYTHLT